MPRLVFQNYFSRPSRYFSFPLVLFLALTKAFAFHSQQVHYYFPFELGRLSSFPILSYQLLTPLCGRLLSKLAAVKGSLDLENLRTNYSAYF